MAEHVHKFALLVSGPDCEHCHYESIIGLAMCECGEEIGPSTIERRLNATERLSGPNAFYAGAQLDEAPDDVPKHLRDYKHGVRLALIEYASALEGEDKNVKKDDGWPDMAFWIG